MHYILLEISIVIGISVLICKVLDSLQKLTTKPTPFLPKLQCLDSGIIAVVVAASSFLVGVLLASEVQASGMRQCRRGRRVS